LRVSELFGRLVKEYGVGPLFGNPGSTEVPLLQHIDDYILTLHDSLSVGMADGYSQYRGYPSIVNLHAMPGVANSVAFIQTAAANHSPVIVTAGQQDYRHMVYDPLLSGNLVGLVSGFVKYAYEIKSPEDVSVAFDRAFRISTSPPRGPVFISFPMNFIDEEIHSDVKKPDRVSTDIVDTSAVEIIAERINESQNPAIIFGAEIDEYDAMDEALRFSEKIGCPVFSEPLGSRASFPTESRRYAGELLPASALMNLTLAEFDLLLFIGADITIYPYLNTPLLPSHRLIFVGLNGSMRLGENYISNPKHFLRSILPLVKKKGDYLKKPDFSRRTRIAKARERMETEYVSHAIAKHFPRFTLVDESISNSEAIRSEFGYRPRGYFTAKTGQLGWGLPAHTGITMAGARSVLVIGDGSLMYSIQTLWTAVRYGIPVKIIVLRNGGYNILRSYSKSFYPSLANAEFFKFGIDAERIIESYGVNVKVLDRDLKAFEWLRDTSEPAAVIVDMPEDIPDLFL